MELETLEFKTQDDWRKWLQENHAIAQLAWLKFAKKNSGATTLSYEEAIEVALCYGWIDSLKKGFDERYWLQKFSPRRAKSIWSQVNREKAETLIKTGLMKPAGLEEVDRAKADGRWDKAYASQSKMTVPDDLAIALRAHPQANAFFETLSSANRYAILFRIHNAANAASRTAKIDKIIAMLSEHQVFHP